MNFREINMFRPYANEVPEALLLAAGADEACLQRWTEAEMLRIAKLADEIVACYAMDRGEGLTFNLHGIVVEPRARRQGLGRWVVGHAIGVAESKGARFVALPRSGGSRMFDHIGFVREGDGIRFDLIQE